MWISFACLKDHDLQEPNSAATTPLGWIFKARCQKLVTHLESHATRAPALSLLERGEYCYIFDWIDDRLYSAILRSLEQTHCRALACGAT